ncbi:DUF4870 domain-containing protein [Subtercola boreus]|uniref:DUF4870 domain-containing protein n=1 Tax=Subtercola boreus TaxID=120213 RepID=A0A3E0WDP5_9MICO|nr:DUF4870 domain-containing protein [Subtercola boreus]RFA21811.1 hypothetical protein B7R24_05895 [Subtercola boreus]RFA21922.1 hypothetical protein B7R23_05840 [Subtercola boreus]RFA27870.1 hypothetical protein B7R25_05965 [Subtercola boreus]
MSDPMAAKPAAPLSAQDDKLWASLAHFGNIILLVPALVIHLVFKDRGRLVRQESTEALNWTINVTGIVVAGNILSAILTYIPFVGGIIALLIGLVIWLVVIVNLVFAIIGGVRVNGGGAYRYPINYRWIK